MFTTALAPGEHMDIDPVFRSGPIDTNGGGIRIAWFWPQVCSEEQLAGEVEGG